MNKTYFVSHNRVHGFWVVMENNAGHYRQIARYSNRQTAVNAAEAFNQQQTQPVMALGAI